MLYFKIGFENGDSFETGFNGTLDEARRYYLGRVFNLGTVVLTDGTVSRRVSSVLVDDADLRLVVDGWQKAVYLPMVDAYHLDGWHIDHHDKTLYIAPNGVNI